MQTIPAETPAGLWDRRRAGVLLHPTSLPGPGNSGVLGENARRFVDLIADSGFTVWQLLPLGPVDSSHSPYQLRSVQAGNPALIDPEQVRRSGWAANAEDLNRQDLIEAASAGFWHRATKAEHRDYHSFMRNNRHWLTLFAIFEALHNARGGEPWWLWPVSLRDRKPGALHKALHEHRDVIRNIIFAQYLFEIQWRALKAYANSRDVYMIGDLPFYVERDSVEVWWYRKLFKLDADGRPTRIAGVPPDYFSADGQLWGNPVYDWDCMQENGFDWWIKRVGFQSQRFDALRIDHFRALESCWEVPANAESAREGHWQPVPGKDLLQALFRQFPDLQFIAEDLGTITPPVRELRDQFGLPGMLVMQFAFDGSPDNPYLTANHRPDAIVYTGTHDNDTSLGWYRNLDDETRAYVNNVIADGQMPEALIDATMASPACLAVLPMQDLLQLGSEARLNTPGTPTGNWTWRFDWRDVPEDFVDRYHRFIVRNGRD